MLIILQLVAVVIGMIYCVVLGKELYKGFSLNYSYIAKLSSIFLVPLWIEGMIVVLLCGREPMMSLAAIVSSGIFGVLLLSILFGGMKQIFGQKWLTIIFIIGIVCAVVTAVFFIELTENSPARNQFMDVHIMMTLLIIGCTIPFAGFAWVLSLLKNNQTSHIAYVKSNKIQHYREHGLSDSDIDFFRSQMAEAKERIENSEKHIQAVAKLRIIETRHNTIDVAKQFFKDIVAEPERLPQAGVFMNKLLPSLEDLTAKYVEISNHVAKNKQTYLILDKSAATIEKLCESITEQYLQFHQSVYNDLDDEIKLANKNLSKANDTINDDVDSLVDDPFAFDDFE
ncbi:5-bromo-4-chloroindolyl phosphate hydrolysis family protein [Tuanshanicoccus lijuaniae]|uniref:5-bromo-4-chloroindolyl phosphate hydrolysis family protein n=1 Tax=Aerococcaceae bacterium zg-1292 TaxID=2774330 RepID=UPI001934BF4C|nr:5-bromo-4-chloroindolyl phosphate hydrolysis family protein [Aerococcaceae bacterium zg-1292]QQA37435.1 5-bromo-4-chloroindolyl phosphate hydrolysis family protein [Aerococcaceae bacterium zg-1292]